MTMARIQPFCRANNNILGYYNNDRVFPRTVTNRDNALYLYNNHFVEYGNLRMLVSIKLFKN